MRVVDSIKYIRPCDLVYFYYNNNDGRDPSHVGMMENSTLYIHQPGRLQETYLNKSKKCIRGIVRYLSDFELLSLYLPTRYWEGKN